jgi:rhodanese-related sulfurtransferase
MNYRNVALVLGIAVVGLGGCWYNRQQQTPPASGKLILVNVLDEQMYVDCHIKGSINVPFAQVEHYFAQGYDKESTEIVVYCSNILCTASGAACKKLLALGFKKVWVYEAGMAEWYQQKLPVEGSCTSSYLTNTVSIHKAVHEGCEVLSTQELVQKMKDTI